MTRVSRFALALVVAIGLGMVVSHAQTRGTLAGTIVDPGGAAMPGVAVALISEADPDTPPRTATTDADGRFRFTDLAAGPYRLEVRATGFGLTVRRGLAVRAAEVTTVTVTPSRGPTAAPRLPPPPPPPPPPPVDAPAAADAGLAVVPVFYATDRAALAGPVLDYGSARRDPASLFLGRFDVSIPRDHRLGEIERPNIWTFWVEDASRHLVITSRKQQSYDEFYADIRSVVDKSTNRDAFVFIHGFNVNFESAVFRTAQMAYDLGFDGAPILYSWPSVATLTPIGYTTDIGNNDWTVTHLRWFLEDVAAKSGATRVHLIAHSMGNKALVNALNQIPASNTKKFSQIVLTAPDMDAGTFIQLADAVKRNAAQTTLYASSNDLALHASKQFFAYKRAGDTAGGILIIPGIDSIDVSGVDTNLIGHFYYGENTSVLSDIVLLLTRGLPPGQRPRLRSEGAIPNLFWRFLPR